jgi:hypothetical protein
MPKNPKPTKQLTLDSLPASTRNEPASANPQKPARQILITGIDTQTKEDELALKVGLKLLPSKAAFSKVQMDLWFDEQKISSISIRIPQGALAADEFELTPILDMKGIPAGVYTVKVGMYEFWSSSGERLFDTAKEVAVDYVHQTRQSRLVKVPSVKSVAGANLEVVSESEKDIYHGIEKTIKKEQLSQRDDW